MKKELNRWQVFLKVDKVLEIHSPLLRELNIGIIKFTSFPVIGERVQTKHYKGLWLRIRFYKWFEFEKYK